MFCLHKINITCFKVTLNIIKLKLNTNDIFCHKIYIVLFTIKILHLDDNKSLDVSKCYKKLFIFFSKLFFNFLKNISKVFFFVENNKNVQDLFEISKFTSQTINKFPKFNFINYNLKILQQKTNYDKFLQTKISKTIENLLLNCLNIYFFLINIFLTIIQNNYFQLCYSFIFFQNIFF